MTFVAQRFSPSLPASANLDALYNAVAAGVATPDQLHAFVDQFAIGSGTGPLATGQSAAGIPLSMSPFALIANMDPRAALQLSPAQVNASLGVDRSKLETRVKEEFAALHRDGLPLEARPGSMLAEAMATGDFSQMSEMDMLAVLIAMAMFRQNRNQPGQVASGGRSALAPRGSWNGNGTNSHGGGGRHAGVNRNANSPTGPAPAGGPIPPGTPSGEALAHAASNVANQMGSVGKCYRGVKAAVRQATGVQLTGGSAYQAANQLASSGRFREVSASPSQLRDLPPGAVVVWGQTDRSPHGHISVALGNGREASDHIQTQMTSLRGAQNYRIFLPA